MNYFDERRDPFPSRVAFPVNVAISLTLREDVAEALAELDSCRYDRANYPQMAAVEVFTRACVYLVLGNASEAVTLYSDAQRRFENFGQWTYAAISAVYSVEAHVTLGHYDEALNAATAAYYYFRTTGCAEDALNAVLRLKDLLVGREGSEEIAKCSRELAKCYGDWLNPRKK